MKFTKICSAFLALLMLLSTVAGLNLISAYAADEEETPTTESEEADGEEEETGIDYMNTYFETAEQKLATMELKLTAYGYELYYESVTGEVAYRNTETGQILFTNPYDVALCGGGATNDTKSMLLSQLIVKYTDNDREYTFNSYTEAALRDQIAFKYIKNGIRVEYTIGREESRILCPRLLEKSKFEELILPYVTAERDYNFIYNFYTLKDPTDPELTEIQVQQMYAQYPITKKGLAVYTLDATSTEREINKIESIIKFYCPHFTYQVLEECHAEVEYEGNEKDPANFKMALEYYLSENGLTVRLPANGIRFNETTYKLSTITILPYFGAGSSECGGYTVIPDGSGTTIEYGALEKPLTISGDLYGSDLAYQTVTSNHAQVMRMPIYGVIENYSHVLGAQAEDLAESGIIYTAPSEEDMGKEIEQMRGYCAIIEEGDALASITSDHGGNSIHKYNSVYTTFTPRPKDTYVLDTSDGSASWTVVCKRKYTGSYKLNIVMLSDTADESKCNTTKYYECSYVGLMKAYRDYLEKNGYITRLTEDDVSSDIPMYIESFGMIEVADTFLSFPTTKDLAITTFDDLTAMYDYLSEKGVKNINFRLDGFANGGMSPTIPYHVKFEKTLGGNEGYQSFLSYANEKGFKVFPEFDFSYVHATGFMDGLSYRKDVVKAMDGRYTAKSILTTSYGSTTATSLNCISPSVFKKFYKNMNTELQEIVDGRTTGISVSTLGTDLNSDFDKKDPYNREDSKSFVEEVLGMMSENYEIMIEGGNAYAANYANHILNAPVDSSHYTAASSAIPLFGMVYHGYVNFAGSPTNMAGNQSYEILKMLENGSYPYFILSYQNTSELKNTSTLSSYYSIRFDILKDTVVEVYNEVNEVLKGLQTEIIENHEFIEAYRVPTEAEVEYDNMLLEKAAEAEAEAQALADEKAELAKKLKARRNGADLVEESEEIEETEEADKTPVTPEGTENGEIEDETATADKNKYLITDGSVVAVTYSNGTVIYLNYNDFEVTILDGTVTIPAQDYLVR